MLIDGKTIAYQIDKGHWTAHRKSVPVLSGELKIGTNSVDVTLGDHLLAMKGRDDLHPSIDMMNPESVSWRRIDPEPKTGRFFLIPGVIYLGFVQERFDCSKPIDMTTIQESLYDGEDRKPWHSHPVARQVYCVPMIDCRSTLARLGLSVHETAGFGDYGFCGNFTLEICVTYCTFLYVGMRIAQISFEEVSAGVSGSRYSGAYTDHIDRPVPPVLGPERF
jgi:deoxycytidine triphosphate deaminase